MSYRCTCTHIDDISTKANSIRDIVNFKEKYGCNYCQNTGPNLWLCLQNNCFQIGCSEIVNDHSTLHNKDNPSHHIQLNLCTSKLWCYTCAQEVFLLPPPDVPVHAVYSKVGHTIQYSGDNAETACVHQMEQEEEEDEGEEGLDEEEEQAEAEDEDDERLESAASAGRKRRGAVAARGRVTVDQHASGGDSSDEGSDNTSSLPQYKHQFSNSKMSSASTTAQQQKQQQLQQQQQRQQKQTYIADSEDSDSSPTRSNHIHSTHVYQHNATSVSTNAVRGGLVGLANIGNTCYMNAALQALSNTKPLTGFFLECQQVVHSLSEGRKPGLSRTYQMLMRDMWLGRRTGGYVTPSGILGGIRNVHAMFRGFQQHDTQEFLRNFMDQLHEELKQELIVHPPPSPAPPSYSKYAINSTDQKLLSNGAAIGSPNSSSGISAHTHSTSSYGGASSIGASPSSNYDSSEGEEYETCDSGVSERSSLSDDTDRSPINVKGSSGGGNLQQLQHKRRLSRSGSPGRKMRTRKQNNSGDQQSSTNCSSSAKPPPIKYRSIISDIFDGKLLSSVQCLTCDRVSSRVETFQDLSLPIPSSRDHLVVIHGRGASVAASATTATSLSCASTAGVSIMDQPSSATSLLPALLPPDGWLSWLLAWLRSWFYGPAVSLHDCLAAFFSRDELKGDNMYSCERCNKLRNGIKYSKVLQLPEVLCIHLKRFRHELMYSSKISAAVAFPLRSLDMRPYLHEKCSSIVTTYHLFAVICHHGTAGGGHYTCYALNNGQWYEFDDQYVTAATADQVTQCQAYVLFYGKCTAQADQVKSVARTLSLVAPMTSPQSGHDCNACSVNAAATGTKPPHVDGLGGPHPTKERIQGEHEGVTDSPPRLCYVSKQWLSRFNTCAEPGPIDNSDFLCRHGNVDPSGQRDLDKLATVFPAQVYEYLLDRFGGCPLIPCNSSASSNQICPICISIHQRINAETDQFFTLNEAWKRSGDHHHQLTHFLSTNWFGRWQAWVQHRTLEPPGPIEKGGRLLQGQVVDDDCAEVNEAIWTFFYDIYGAGPDVHVAPVAPSDDSLRQSHVQRHNHTPSNEPMSNSESDSEHQEEDEDDENQVEHMNQRQQQHVDIADKDSMDVDETPQFVIPALRRDVTTTTANVNKRLYGRGEPEHVQTPDVEMETGLCNGDAAVLENHSSAASGAQLQAAHTLTVTTETMEGRSERGENSSESNRYRRRRMRDT